VCHAPVACTISETSPAGLLPRAAGIRCIVRSLSCTWCRGSCCGFCSVPNQHTGRANPVDSGLAGTARGWTPISDRAWLPQILDADAAFSFGRCDGRGRRGPALQGAGGCCRGDPGRSCGPDFYHNEALGPAGRGRWRALLADPAGGERRSERRTRSLANCQTSFGVKPRRYACARQSTLASGIVQVALWTAGGMGGAICAGVCR